MKTAFILIVVILFSFFILYPIWIGITGSLKPDEDFLAAPAFVFPDNPTLEKYIEAWDVLKRALFFSFKIAIMTMAIAIVVGVIGGYLLSQHHNFKGLKLLLILCVFGIYIPGVSKLIPIIKIVQFFRLLDTPWGVGIALGSMQLPIATILYRQFFLKFPKSFFEVAEISGADHIQILRNIIIPLSKTPTMTVAILSISIGWNNLLFPLVLTSSEPSTVTVAITSLVYEAKQYSVYNKLLAGTIIAAL
jgi:glucose/mannose transport system permease protein